VRVMSTLFWVEWVGEECEWFHATLYILDLCIISIGMVLGLFFDMFIIIVDIFNCKLTLIISLPLPSAKCQWKI